MTCPRSWNKIPYFFEIMHIHWRHWTMDLDQLTPFEDIYYLLLRPEVCYGQFTWPQQSRRNTKACDLLTTAIWTISETDLLLSLMYRIFVQAINLSLRRNNAMDPWMDAIHWSCPVLSYKCNLHHKCGTSWLLFWLLLLWLVYLCIMLLRVKGWKVIRLKPRD